MCSIPFLNLILVPYLLTRRQNCFFIWPAYKWTTEFRSSNSIYMSTISPCINRRDHLGFRKQCGGRFWISNIGWKQIATKQQQYQYEMSLRVASRRYSWERRNSSMTKEWRRFLWTYCVLMRLQYVHRYFWHMPTTKCKDVIFIHLNNFNNNLSLMCIKCFVLWNMWLCNLKAVLHLPLPTHINKSNTLHPCSSQ